MSQRSHFRRAAPLRAPSLLRIVLLALLLLPALALAEPGNLTPDNSKALIVEPFAYEFPDDKVGDNAKGVLEHHHYTITRMTAAKDGKAGTPPSVTLDKVRVEFEKGYGAVVISSHGGSSGVLLESYETEAARDAAYDALIVAGYKAEEIFKGSLDSGSEGIGFTLKGIKKYFKNANAIVYNASCCGQALTDWPCREYLYYEGTVGDTHASSDALFFWRRMDGNDAAYTRSVGKARTSNAISDRLQGSGAGGGATVLSPAVDYSGYVSRAQEKVIRNDRREPKAWAATTGFVQFDCAMKIKDGTTDIDPATLLKATNATLSNVKWASSENGKPSDKITFDVAIAADKDSAVFTVDNAKALALTSGIRLNGNQNPNEFYSGEGPNQVDYIWKVFKNGARASLDCPAPRHVSANYPVYVWYQVCNDGDGPGVFACDLHDDQGWLADGPQTFETSLAAHECQTLYFTVNPGSCVPGTPDGFHWSASAEDTPGDAASCTQLADCVALTGAAVSGLALSARDDGIRISWNSLEASAARFRVERATGPTGDFEVVSPDISGSGRADFEWTDRAIQPGTDYRYRVGAQVGQEWSWFGPARITSPEARFALLGAVPNPFAQGTRLRFNLARSGPARVEVFDVRGARVALLLDGPRPAGAQDVAWDGRDDSRRRLPAGNYMIRVSSGGRSLVSKVLLLGSWSPSP